MIRDGNYFDRWNKFDADKIVDKMEEDEYYDNKNIQAINPYSND